MTKFFKTLSATLAAGVMLAGTAQAETRVTYKSAKSGSSYYQMGVELAEAMKVGTNGDIIVTIEESQGSTQNVMEVRARGGDYVFTTPPVLVSLAQKGKGPFGATEGEKYLTLFGLADKVEIADAELSNAVAALKNGQIGAFVTAGSFPAPNVVEAAASTPVRLVSLTPEQVAETKRTKLVIPAGTYAGQTEDVTTTSLPVAAFTTTKMDEDTAYQLTRTYWEQKAEMADTSAWWNGVTEELMANITTPLHPGAVRYYEEAGFTLSDAQKQ